MTAGCVEPPTRQNNPHTVWQFTCAEFIFGDILTAVTTSICAALDHGQVVASIVILVIDFIHNFTDKEPAKPTRFTLFQQLTWLFIRERGGIEWRAIVAYRDRQIILFTLTDYLKAVALVLFPINLLDDNVTPLLDS